MSPSPPNSTPAVVVPLYDARPSPELRRSPAPFFGAKAEPDYEALCPHSTDGGDDDLSSSRIKYERTVAEAGAGSNARRAWLGLLLVVAGLLCADLWRGIAVTPAGAGEGWAAEINRTVEVVVPASNTVVVTDHYGFNPEEKTVILFGKRALESGFCGRASR